MKIHRLVQAPKELGEIRSRLLTVCFFFALGAVLGFVLHGVVTPEDDQRLREYILQYAQLSAAQDDSAASLLSVVGVYFRYPLLVFLLGYTAVGLVLIPVVCIFQGCSLAFSIGCFVSALGRDGAALAMAAFGLRCLVVLPCTLLLAVYSMDSARRRLRTQGSRRSRKENPYGPQHYLRLAVCIVLLLLGSAAELAFVPDIFELALSRMTL